VLNGAEKEPCNYNVMKLHKAYVLN